MTGEFLRHVPIPRADGAEAIDAVVEAGFHVNCYVDDELYVAEVTPEARRYADFQDLEIHAVGDLHEWLDDDPTKLVAVGDPAALDELEDELKPRFAGRLFVSKSLPHFLEFAHPDVSKGTGLAVRRGPARLHGRARRSRAATARTTASCSTGPASASPSRTRTRTILERADLVVPDVQEEGVALLLEAYLDSLRDRPPRSPHRPRRDSAPRSRARAPPSSSTSCSPPTAQSSTCSRGSRSCARRGSSKGKPTPEQLEELSG